jgi:nucleoside-diphosphate-sugar epimerase
MFFETPALSWALSEKEGIEMPPVLEGKVCVFGAGGPVGAISASLLSERYTMRFVDLAPIEQFLAKPHNPLWPGWSKAPEPPHEWVQADITDYAQVENALRGCDAVINLTVNRSKPELAFRVNAIGAYNIAKAAHKLGMKRFLQTGVIVVTGYGFDGDMRYDSRVPDDIPLHPGSNLYPLTKMLGHSLVDAWAERTGLDVITYVFHRLRPHDLLDNRDDNAVIPYSVAWEDLGPALLCGLRAPQMERPNERFFICARMPMGKYAPDKAERLLGWKPRHNFEKFYRLPKPEGLI